MGNKLRRSEVSSLKIMQSYTLPRRRRIGRGSRCQWRDQQTLKAKRPSSSQQFESTLRPPVISLIHFHDSTTPKYILLSTMLRSALLGKSTKTPSSISLETSTILTLLYHKTPIPNIRMRKVEVSRVVACQVSRSSKTHNTEATRDGIEWTRHSNPVTTAPEVDETTIRGNRTEASGEQNRARKRYRLEYRDLWTPFGGAAVISFFLEFLSHLACV